MQTSDTVDFDERIELIQSLRAENLVSADHAMELLTTWTDPEWAEFKIEWEQSKDPNWDPENQVYLIPKKKKAA